MAPHWHHKDYYGFLLFNRIFANAATDKNAMGELPDGTRHECIYSPYSDTAIFGHYFSGNEIFAKIISDCGTALNTIYGYNLNEVDVFRSKNKLYHELAQIQTVSDIMQSIGPQILYLNRRVHRSEIAKRVSHIDANHLKNLCTEWFNGTPTSITNWGPIEGLPSTGTFEHFSVNIV